MRIPQSRALSLALIAALALPIAGCARNRARTDLPYVARDVGTLYTTAKNRLDQGRFKEAALLFDEVERQHPYSIWARRAQLMSAFSYYLSRDYTQAIQSAQRFLSVHPGNRDAPYAYYLIALSYYEQITDVTRDQKITRQALDALGELMRRYPNTRYAADARLKVDLVNDHLAGKEMEIGRFYEGRGQWLAASMRFRTVIDQYQTTTHAPEALMRLTETYLALGVPNEAQRSAAVLGRNYPGSDWYKRAYRLMEQHPAKPLPPVAPGQPVVPDGTPGSVNTGLPGESGSGTPTTGPATQPSTVGPNSSPNTGGRTN
ncbi:outer membrane protein assembly factor BamD [Sphingomonas carotinifaciens]|uniref:Outer membrane protein assembly factor BamD n=1 Tax=Sphingomonas carotinifaciens TaxID=1166323 RepID=A0A1G7FXA6_9SPHN|nr:outer membrane protein assembly factor BamD [Sphingomonas carotinifaciens]MBB4086277.1 outer membrane protein assembly factor BamD [Sphingomonas carotinifaciens]MWC42600.1 outer membrane protein assembly factor BamD [Sphingomonas carotinifaciens]SDE80509.1 Beta-barrel assembly machine subunit BamD [Sphingomonas carotinifaciens]